jgi:heptosyltransferase-2
MTDCRHFNGYKPCGKSEICDSLCPSLSVPTVRVLLIHLEALGAVVRSTALLTAIRRKFPGAHITWVTQKPADQILLHHPSIDRLLTTTSDDLLQLSVLEFDVALVVDKGLKSAGVLKMTKADLVFGFEVDTRTGAVKPATPAAQELWEIGLSDRKKFFENKKPETRLLHEALELGSWLRDEYSIVLQESERLEALKRRESWAEGREFVVGINTGCSPMLPHKKLTVEMQAEIATRLGADPRFKVVLLGGREDTARNQRIQEIVNPSGASKSPGSSVISSPTEQGLRDGMVSVAACDIVVSGDSLGMHLAIGLKKWTVAWFGPSCAHEIDLFDRGVAIHTKASCSPCWKRSCSRTTMCYDLVSIDEIIAGVHSGAVALKSQATNISFISSRESDTCPKDLTTP